MKRSKFTDEQILAIVRRLRRPEGRGPGPDARDHRADVLPLEAKYGGIELSEMQRLRQVEDEHRVKQILAEQTLDIQGLKAVVAKSGRPHRSARGGGAGCRRAARVCGGRAGRVVFDTDAIGRSEGIGQQTSGIALPTPEVQASGVGDAR